MSCSICKKTNHVDKDCYFRQDKGKRTDNKKVSFLLGASSVGSSSWIIDSGSTSHMVNNDSLLTNKEKVNSEITLAKKGKTMRADSVGQVVLNNCTLSDVLYVPDLMKNLLSVSAITSKGREVIFKGKEVIVRQGDTTYMQGRRNSSGLYEIQFLPEERAFYAQKEKKLDRWHRRFGHIGNSQLKKLLTMSSGINLKEKDVTEENDVCDICMRAKQTRKPFNKERTRATRALEIIHTDVCGPIDPITWDGNRYFITFLDDYTHHTSVYPMKGKFEVFEKVKEYIQEAESK